VDVNGRGGRRRQKETNDLLVLDVRERVRVCVKG